MALGLPNASDFKKCFCIYLSVSIIDLLMCNVYCILSRTVCGQAVESGRSGCCRRGGQRPSGRTYTHYQGKLHRCSQLFDREDYM